MEADILQFGAIGDGRIDDSRAIQEAIDACSKAGGGRIVFPGGKVFSAGPFHLRSNVELHLQSNTIIQASLDQALYKESAFKKNRSEGSLWISAREQENIAITGTGTIDGRGTHFMLSEEPTHFNYSIEDGVDMRPHLLTFIGCRNITIRDVTFRNAAYWCIHPVGCNDVLIQGVRILNSLKIQNCDGIDLDHSRNVRISDCYIESADDCICLKTRREYDEYGPTENITVTGCTLVSTSCAIKLGSENTKGIRNAVFGSIVITSTNRAVGIQNRDEGRIENIIFSGVVAECRLFANIWWGKAEPIHVTSLMRSPLETRRFPENLERTTVGSVENISFINFICRSENGIFVSGCADSRPRNICFDNVRVHIDKETKHPGGFHDQRPCDAPEMVDTRTSGFHIVSCDNVRVMNSQVSWGENLPDYYESALFAEDVSQIELINFEGKAAHGEESKAIVIVDS